MKLMSQKLFKRAPEEAWPQIPPVIRGGHDLSLITAGSELVGTFDSHDAPFDPEMLLRRIEFQETGWLNDPDGLHHISARVCAPDVFPNAALVAFAAHRGCQQDPQEQWRRRENILVYH
ncbi:hypothetical protein [Candidatus Binatus sp.]|uniref:hypothetical protein n=1 Tax=Candidatus Binatus sp. TaxID=2811406 RepID=UPI003F9B7307